MNELRSRTVAGLGGLSLAVQERGRAGAPTVILVHGYPDNHHLWDLVAEHLEADHHVVTYDVRGAGESGVPNGRSGYRMEALVADLVAVADAVSPDRPVHLVAHDWGSIQSWAAVTDPDAAPRFASYTSMSGPSLDHVGAWIRARMRPGNGHWRELLNQATHSWYIYAFHTPFAPFAWRHGLARLWPMMLERREGATVDENWPGTSLATDAARGVDLYRANIFQHTRRLGKVHTEVPVQLLVASADAFVTPSLVDGMEELATTFVRRDVGGQRWLPRSRPDQVARWVSEHVAAVEAEAKPAGRRPSPVVVTGAGSGIGRSVCLAFAERGAHIIATDLSADSAEHTAERCRLAGATAEFHQLDVTDGSAMEALAAKVGAEHGGPPWWSTTLVSEWQGASSTPPMTTGNRSSTSTCGGSSAAHSPSGA